MADISADILKQLLHYDPETGVFTRIAALNWKGELIAPRSPATGSVIGRGGYATIAVGGRGKRFLAHRLAWLYVHGAWPTGEIDHINGDKMDNRFANLRDGSHALNCQNQRRPQSSNKVGLLGVSPQGEKFAAFITVRGHSRRLGSFDTPEQAHDAYLDAKRELHEFATI
jgi:hypothetical protein